MKSIKAFDVFRKVSEPDHNQQTSTGALITVIAMSVMIFLFLTETLSFISPTVQKTTLVDQDRGASKLQINLKIEFPQSPCVAMSLDQMDEVGNHKIDVQGKLIKRRLDKNGKEIPGEVSPSVDSITQAINNAEGCILEGFVYVLKVPGNFHISFHANHHIMHQIPHALVTKARMDHTIHHLSFGSQSKNKYITDVYGQGEQSNFSPLDGSVKKDLHGRVSKHEYYFKITPTQYYDEINNEELHSYQFSHGSRSDMINAMFGSVWFRYDIENITMRYTIENKSLVSFIISLCAILGGVFAVLGIVHSLLQEAIRVTSKND